MRLKLKEDRREWQKFTAVIMVLLLIAGTLFWRQSILNRSGFLCLVAAALAICAFSLVYPRAFRPFYRFGMTLSFHVGRVIGAVTLTLFFLFLVTPLGLLLRVLGKDLLQIKRRSSTTTYWHPAKEPGPLDRLF